MPDNDKQSPLIVNGELMLYGYVGGDPDDSWFPGFSASHVAKALAEMDGDLVVRLNSGGGSAWDGVAIYNLLVGYEGGTVTTKVDGIAASAASVILMAGAEVVTPATATVMIHDASIITIGNADDHRSSAEMLEKLDGQMAELYADKCGKPVDEMSALMDAETWLTGTECVEIGLSDTTGAANDNAEDEAAAAAAFPYQLFAHTPAEIAASAVAMTDDLRQQLPRIGLRPTGVSPVATKQPKPAAPAPATAATLETLNMVKKISEPVNPKTGDDAQAAAEAAVKAERERAAGIRRAVAKAGLPSDFADQLIEEGTALADAHAQIIDKLDDDDTVQTRSHVRVEVGAESRERFRQGVEQSLCAKLGLEDGERNEFTSLSLFEIARASLEHANIKLAGIGDRMQIASVALNPMMAGYHSTDDFTEILANVANKAMLKGWDETPETFDLWTSRGTLTDFKPMKKVDLNAFPSLVEVPQGAEYQYASVGDRGETIQLATYGRMFSITRQSIINDDLSMFDRLPRKMGRAARRTVANLVYAILTGNPTMADGVALFHADHGNLAGSGAAPGAATVQAAKVAMGTQKDPDNNVSSLNIRPRYMLVPMAIEDIAQQLAVSEYDPAKSTRAANVHRGSFEVISDARLDNASATAWYMAGDPSVHDTIEVSYLDGQASPTLERRIGWNVDGVEMKVRIDTGAKALDHRALYKNAGA